MKAKRITTYLSYNKVIGTSLDEKLYLAFQILDYALLSAPGAPLKKALLDAGIGKDIMDHMIMEFISRFFLLFLKMQIWSRRKRLWK